MGLAWVNNGQPPVFWNQVIAFVAVMLHLWKPPQGLGFQWHTWVWSNSCWTSEMSASPFAPFFYDFLLNIFTLRKWYFCLESSQEEKKQNELINISLFSCWKPLLLLLITIYILKNKNKVELPWSHLKS